MQSSFAPLICVYAQLGFIKTFSPCSLFFLFFFVEQEWIRALKYLGVRCRGFGISRVLQFIISCVGRPLLSRAKHFTIFPMVFHSYIDYGFPFNIFSPRSKLHFLKSAGFVRFASGFNICSAQPKAGENLWSIPCERYESIMVCHFYLNLRVN